MNAEHRTWFPFIMTGLTIGILIFFFAYGRPVEAPAVEEGIEAPTHEEYVAQVEGILTTYNQQNDAGQTRDELLQLTVPAADQDTHLELVIAFSEIANGKVEEGQSRLAVLKSRVDWLNILP